MEWTDFASLISLPLIAIVGFAIRQSQAAKKEAGECKDALAAYKTEVAKNYASMKYLKDVETRIVAHLEKIEDKLDRYANGRRGRE